MDAQPDSLGRLWGHCAHVGEVGDDDGMQPNCRSPHHFGWWIATGVLSLTTGSGLAILAWSMSGQALAVADQWASVSGLLLAYVVVAVSVVRWTVDRARRSRSGADLNETVATRLRRAVRRQWLDEAGARQLERSRPLRLRWRSTTRPVAVSASDPGRAGQQLAGALVQDLADSRPSAVALVEAFTGQAHRQLVILGEPGAGKTTLALLFVLAATDAAGPDDPVPVLLSVAGWIPPERSGAPERIEDWVLRRLAEDYPHLASRGEDGVRRLMADQRVVPVLDGLDEMPSQLLGRALQDLDRAAGSGLRMVLTCRSAEFERAVAEDGPLSHAAVVEIEPVRAEDVAVYLVQREAAAANRWTPVLQQMQQRPDGPLAAGLSTPLMISLARRVYRESGRSPRELTGLPTAPAVRQHLLGRFLSTVYPTPRVAVRAERWLAFLSHHLRERVRDPNLYWWQLARAVPRPVLTALVAGAVTILGLLFGLATGVVLVLRQHLSLGELWGVTLTVAIVGWILGTLAGLHAGRAAHPPRRGRPPPGVVSGVLGDLGVVTVMLCVVLAATALLLLAMYAVAQPTAIAYTMQLRARADVETLPYMAILVVGVVVVTNALGAGRMGVPRRSMPRVRDALPSLAVGLGIGVLLGLPAAGIGWLFYPDLEYALWNGLLVAVVIGVPIGLGRWLSTPVEEQAASSPESVLRGDRTALLVAVGGVGICTFAASFATLWLPTPDDLASDLEGNLIFGALVGGAAAVVVFFGSGAPWLSYTVARLWLALWGRLPWRLTRFLWHAREAGVLRQTGPAYQVRHDLLRTYLADRYQSAVPRYVRTVTGTDSGGTEPGAAAPRRRRWHAVLGVAMAVALLPAVVAFVEPGTRPQITLPLTGAPEDEVIALAFRPDGATLTAVTTDGTGDFRRTWQWRLSDGAIIMHPTITHPTATDHGDWFTDTDVAVSSYGTSVTAVFIDPDHNGVLVQDTVGSTVDLCNLGRCGPPVRCSPDNDVVRDVSISADGGSVVTGSWCSLQLWPIATGGVMTASPITITRGRIDGLAVSPGGTRVAAGVEGGMVRVWDVATHEVTALSDSLCYDCYRELVFSGNGAVLAAATDEIEMYSDDTVRVWRVVDGALLSTIAIRGTPSKLAITPGGETVATYDWDGIMRLWDVETGRHIATLPSPVADAAFSPDGTILATGAQGAVQLWNVPELVAAQS